MSTSKLPLSAVIFDRSQKGLSDVPIFSDALKRKVNTPSQEISDLALSPVAQHILNSIQNRALAKPVVVNPVVVSPSRADSDRGQTSVSAQGGDDQVTGKVSILFEDPSIVRNNLEAEAILSQLRALTSHFPPIQSAIIGAPQYQRIQISNVPLLLSEHHKAGLVDFVVIPTSSIFVSSSVDEYVVWLRREFWKLQLLLREQLLSLPEKKEVVQIRIEELLELLRKGLEVLVTVPKTVGRGLIFVGVKGFGKSSKVFRGLTRQSGSQLEGVSAQGQKIWEEKWKQVESKKPVFDPAQVSVVKNAVVLKLKELQGVLASSNRPSFTKLASRIMIAGSLVLMLLTVGPMVALEAQSIRQKIVYSIQSLRTQASDTEHDKTLSGTPTPAPTPNPDPEKQFQILIPKIGVDSKVVANVDPGNEKEYTEALKKGVAHAAGTGLPGEANTNNKTIFIFGHSTNGAWNVSRYNALFYSLKDMVVGDSFTMWFWGKEFTYKVTETKVVAANDISFLTPQTDKDQLILQTCWPPGTSWKRFLVIAEPVK